METFLLVASKLTSARYSNLEVWVLVWTAIYIGHGDFWSAAFAFVFGVLFTAIANALVRRLT